MPTGLVRRSAQQRRSLRPTRLLAAVVAVLAACSGHEPTTPGTAGTMGDASGRAVSPSGLEQRLATRVETPAIGSSYTALLTATSTLVNTGTAPVHVKARTCFVTDTDVESTAKMDRFEPFVTCAAASVETDLKPGESLGPLEAHFGVRSGSGRYTLRLRHALAPELRAEAAFQVP